MSSSRHYREPPRTRSSYPSNYHSNHPPAPAYHLREQSRDHDHSVERDHDRNIHPMHDRDYDRVNHLARGIYHHSTSLSSIHSANHSADRSSSHSRHHSSDRSRDRSRSPDHRARDYERSNHQYIPPFRPDDEPVYRLSRRSRSRSRSPHNRKPISHHPGIPHSSNHRSSSPDDRSHSHTNPHPGHPSHIQPHHQSSRSRDREYEHHQLGKRSDDSSSNQPVQRSDSRQPISSLNRQFDRPNNPEINPLLNKPTEPHGNQPYRHSSVPSPRNSQSGKQSNHESSIAYSNDQQFASRSNSKSNGSNSPSRYDSSCPSPTNHTAYIDRKQSIHQSLNHANNQAINQSINQSLSPSTPDSEFSLMEQPVDSSNNQFFSQPSMLSSIGESINQSGKQLHKQSSNQSALRPLGQTAVAPIIKLSIKQAVSQPIKQPIKQPVSQLASPRSATKPIVTSAIAPATPSINDQYFTLRSSHRERYLFINQSIKQTNDQSLTQLNDRWLTLFLSLFYAGEDIMRSDKHSNNESTNQSTNQSANQSAKKPNDQPVDELDKQATNHSININPAVDLANPSATEPNDQPVKQSINQPPSQLFPLIITCAALARSINQLESATQSNNQSDQSNSHTTDQLIKTVSSLSSDSLLKMIDKAINAPFFDHIDHSLNQSINQSNNRSIDQAIIEDQKMNPLYHLWKLFFYPNDQSIDQPINQSINQSTNPSIALPISVSQSISQAVKQLKHPFLYDHLQRFCNRLIDPVVSPSNDQKSSSQSNNQTIKQSNNRTVAIPSTRAIRLITSLADRLIVCGAKTGYWAAILDHSLNKSRLVNQPVNPSNNQSNQRSNDPFPLVVALDDSPWIKQSNQSINQSVEQSINESVEMYYDVTKVVPFDDPSTQTNYQPIIAHAELEEGEIFQEDMICETLIQSIDQSTLSMNQWLQVNNQSIKDRGILFSCLIDDLIGLPSNPVIRLSIDQSNKQIKTRSNNQTNKTLIQQSIVPSDPVLSTRRILIERCIKAAQPKYVFLIVESSLDHPSIHPSINQSISKSLDLSSSDWEELTDLPMLPQWHNVRHTLHAWKRIGNETDHNM